MKNTFLFKALLLIVILPIIFLGCTDKISYDLVITNVGLFDGEKDLGTVNVGINTDSIAVITQDEIISENTVDGTGKYIIPGMVNAHVHVSALEELKEGYPYGILSNLNMHTGLEDRELQWKQMAQDSVGFPFLYGAGHAATVPGGHPNQFSRDMETINDSISIEEWVDNRIAKGVDYIKIVREHHEWMGYPPLPTLSYGQIERIINYARSKGYKTVVHANTAEEMTEIAKFNPNGFVHMLQYKEELPIAENFYKILAESGVFIVPNAGMNLMPMDDAPPFIQNWVRENLFDAEQSAEVIKKFHEYNIPIVAGTDAQAGAMNFGSDFYLELKLYERAGLSNLEILKTATGNAAKAFEIPVGLLKEGSKANMLLLRGNPIEDLWQIKNIEQIWKNGKSNN